MKHGDFTYRMIQSLKSMSCHMFLEMSLDLFTNRLCLKITKTRTQQQQQQQQQQQRQQHKKLFFLWLLTSSKVWWDWIDRWSDGQARRAETGSFGFFVSDVWLLKNICIMDMFFGGKCFAGVIFTRNEPRIFRCRLSQKLLEFLNVSDRVSSRIFVSFCWNKF